MFRRRWSGLPADPVFPSDLRELGYFINDIGEIRSIESPDYYFQYHLTKNQRWNDRQSFAFKEAIRKEIHARLAATGYTIVPLPLGTPTDKPHVPVLTSPNLATATRAVLLFGESCQSLGVLAQRVAGGRGGIPRGSVLALADALKKQQCSATDSSPPALVLANAGELWWWPEGQHGLTHIDRHSIPMASAVHAGRYHDPNLNEVPGNRTVAEHVKSVFESVVIGKTMVRKDAKMDVIVVGDTADEVQRYLDDEEVWKRVDGKLGTLVVLGGTYSSKNFNCESFKRFMRERGRAYIIHHSSLDTLIAGPSGNPGAAGFTTYGCPVFSAGEDALYIETLLIGAQPALLSWIQKVALEGEDYKNEVVEIFGEEGSSVGTEEPYSTWASFEPSAGDEPVAENAQENTLVSDHAAECESDKAQIKQKADDDVSNPTKAEGEVVRPGNGEKVGVKADAKAAEADVGPDAKEMKDLVEEVKNFKIDH